jgi:hypothetical protein
MSILVPTSQASIQMEIYGYDNEYGTGYTFTGSEGYYSLYVQAFWSTPSAAITAGQGVHVTDLGVTYEQGHLYHIQGPDGSPFWIGTLLAWIPVFEVFDLSMSKIGVYSNHLDLHFHADAGGPYRLGPGQSITVDTSQSYLVQYGWNPADSLQLPGAMGIMECKIDGQTVEPLVSYDYLVNTLRLSSGIHTLQVDIEALGEFYQLWETAFSTIEIIPEPATILLLTFGGLLIRKR